jgi:hypothetical protein
MKLLPLLVTYLLGWKIKNRANYISGAVASQCAGNGA